MGCTHKRDATRLPTSKPVFAKTEGLLKIAGMSWDIMIQDFPADAKQVSDIPEDFQPRPIGARSTLIENIEEVFPDVDFSDPAWGILERADFSIEFNIGEDEICEDFMLHVRGGGAVVEAIEQLLARMQLRAIDCQTGEFFSVEAAE